MLTENIAIVFIAKPYKILFMLRVYAALLPDVPYIPLLYPNLGHQERESILFLNHAFRYLTQPIVELTDNLAEADCILLAHNYPALLRHHQTFIDQQAALAQGHGKRLLVFWHGDRDDPVDIPHATVFRTSLYASDTRPNERAMPQSLASDVAMPAYADDLLGDDRLQVRQKTGDKPVIGFCGWAQYKNLKNRIATPVLNAMQMMRGSPARRKGLTLRMEAIRALQRSDAVQCNFLLRSSYSGHQKTIRTDAETARREYRDNLLGSDLALVIKGDGNYSYRFYEALSLGRIPLLLDTGCVLPLEDTIDYDSFVLRVDYRQLHRLPDIASDWWERLAPQEFAAMQERGREAFETYLRIDRFFEHAMENVKSLSS